MNAKQQQRLINFGHTVVDSDYKPYFIYESCPSSASSTSTLSAKIPAAADAATIEPPEQEEEGDKYEAKLVKTIENAQLDFDKWYQEDLGRTTTKQQKQSQQQNVKKTQRCLSKSPCFRSNSSNNKSASNSGRNKNVLKFNYRISTSHSTLGLHTDVDDSVRFIQQQQQQHKQPRPRPLGVKTTSSLSSSSVLNISHHSHQSRISATTAAKQPTTSFTARTKDIRRYSILPSYNYVKDSMLRLYPTSSLSVSPPSHSSLSHPRRRNAQTVSASRIPIKSGSSLLAARLVLLEGEGGDIKPYQPSFLSSSSTLMSLLVDSQEQTIKENKYVS